jgi:hypothetical protein
MNKLSKAISVFGLFVLPILIGVGCDDSGSDSNGGSVIVTKTEYDEIQKGMSYDEVVAIIGSSGTLTGGEGPNVGWYKWSNGNGSSVTVSFIHNGVFDKVPKGDLPGANTSSGSSSSSGSSGGSGSGSGSGAIVTQSEYNKIESGMSYDQVVTIIGAKGTAVANVDTQLTTYEWRNSNGSYAGVQISTTWVLGIGVIQKYNSGNLP